MTTGFARMEGRGGNNPPVRPLLRALLRGAGLYAEHHKPDREQAGPTEPSSSIQQQPARHSCAAPVIRKLMKLKPMGGPLGGTKTS